MSDRRTHRARRFRGAGWLTGVGLLVQAATFTGTSPTTFLIFALVGGTLVACGIALYLLTLLGESGSSQAVRGR